MNDSPKCHMCIYETCPADCKEENCPTIEEEKIPDKKDMQRATWQEVMRMMNRRSGDAL